MNQLLKLGGQSIGASASAPVFLMNIQNLFLLGLTGFDLLQFKGLSGIFFSTAVWKHQFFSPVLFRAIKYLVKNRPFLAQIRLLRGWLNDSVLDHELLKQPTV